MRLCAEPNSNADSYSNADTNRDSHDADITAQRWNDAAATRREYCPTQFGPTNPGDSKLGFWIQTLERSRRRPD